MSRSPLLNVTSMGKAQQAFAFQSSFGLALHLGSDMIPLFLV
jgi:hypothetical protein